MSNRELRPCPFCGGEAKIKHIVPLAATVSCTICKATSAEIPASLQYCADEEAAKSWNRRTNKGTEWIPVTERLPMGAKDGEAAEDVVAYFVDNDIGAQVCTGWLNGNTWYLVVGYDRYHTEHGMESVTHWMPLPAPPTHEKKSTDLEVASE